jgi:hypothetical protein
VARQLTPEEKEDIRALHLEGIRSAVLQEIYGVGETLIRQVTSAPPAPDEVDYAWTRRRALETEREEAAPKFSGWVDEQAEVVAALFECEPCGGDAILDQNGDPRVRVTF